jgi:alpha-N-arabinofuranosidase
MRWISKHFLALEHIERKAVCDKEALKMIYRRDFLKAVSASAVSVLIPSTSEGSPALGSLMGEVHVDAGVVQHTIDSRIHGHFIEHLGRVIHQGLWAELLRNRKFYPVDPEFTQIADPWKAESDRSHVSYVIDQINSLNGISSQRVTLFGEASGWRGISQTGFDVLGGRKYIASAWIKGGPASRRVTFRLRTSGGEIAADGEAALQPADWNKYEVRLQPSRDIRQAVFQIAFDSPGTNWIGAASLMPADHVGGMRRDVVEMFKTLGPTILRWPGGCYADAYDWRKAIGPRDRRPPVPIIPLGYPNGYDHGMDPNDFGTDEFLELCSVMEAEPYINANFGMGTPEMAAAWVEYCNGSTGTKWGSERATNGHPKPYDVKNWAIGNEVWGDPYESGHTTAEGYSSGYVPIARAMRTVDPEIEITAVGAFTDNGLEKDWNLTLLTATGKEIDFLSLHDYYPAGFWRPELLNSPLKQYLAVMAEPTRVAEKMRDLIFLMDRATLGQKRIQIAFDEWNELDWNYPLLEGSPSRDAFMNYFTDVVRKTALEFNQTQRDGLYGARMMHNFMRFGDRVPIAVRTHPINSLAAMRTDSAQVFMTASGKMMQLYRQHSGTEFVQASAQSPTFDVPEEGWTGIPYLDAIATQAVDGQKLFIQMLNLHPSEPMETRVLIRGNSVQARGDIWQIAPEDFMAWNDFGITNVDIKHIPLESISNDDVYHLPPHSATILEIGLH